MYKRKTPIKPPQGGDQQPSVVPPVVDVKQQSQHQPPLQQQQQPPPPQQQRPQQPPQSQPQWDDEEIDVDRLLEMGMDEEPPDYPYDDDFEGGPPDDYDPTADMPDEYEAKQPIVKQEAPQQQQQASGSKLSSLLAAANQASAQQQQAEQNPLVPTAPRTVALKLKSVQNKIPEHIKQQLDISEQRGVKLATTLKRPHGTPGGPSGEQQFALADDVFNRVRNGYDPVVLANKQAAQRAELAKRTAKTRELQQQLAQQELERAAQQVRESFTARFSKHTQNALLPEFKPKQRGTTGVKLNYPQIRPNSDPYVHAAGKWRRAEEISGCINEDMSILHDLAEYEPYKEYLETPRVFARTKGWSEFMPIGQPELNFDLNKSFDGGVPFYEIKPQQQIKSEMNDDDCSDDDDDSENDDDGGDDSEDERTRLKRKKKRREARRIAKAKAKSTIAAAQSIHPPLYILLESRQQKKLRLEARALTLEAAQKILLNTAGVVNQINDVIQQHHAELQMQQQQQQISNNTTKNGNTSIVKCLAGVLPQIRKLSIANRKHLLSTILQQHQQKKQEADNKENLLDYIQLLKEQHAARLESARKLQLHEDSIQKLRIKQQMEIDLAMALAEAQQQQKERQQQREQEIRRRSLLGLAPINNNNNNNNAIKREQNIKQEPGTSASTDDNDILNDNDELDHIAILNSVLEKNPQYQEFIAENTTLEYLQEEFGFQVSHATMHGEAQDHDDLDDDVGRPAGQVENYAELGNAKGNNNKTTKKKGKNGNKNEPIVGQLFVDKYAPRLYSHLLSPERYNRDVLGWLAKYNNIVFNKPVPKPVQYKSQRHLQWENDQREKAKAAGGNALEQANVQQAQRDAQTSLQHDITTKFGPQHQKVLLLAGPPGAGKTVMINVLLKLLKYRKVEINASDDRSYDAVSQQISNVLESNSAFDNGTTGKEVRPNCLVLEEIDGAVSVGSGGVIENDNAASSVIELLIKICKDAVAYDRFQINKMLSQDDEDKDGGDDDGDGDNNNKKKDGGDAAKNPGKQLKRPIIATCNVLQAPALKALLPYCKVIELPSIEKGALLERLQSIAQQEQIACDDTFLRGLVDLLGTDIRSCLHALQFSSHRPAPFANPVLAKSNIARTKILTQHDLKKLCLGSHDSPTSIQDVAQLCLTLQESNTTLAIGTTTGKEVGGNQSTRFDQHLNSIAALRSRYNILTLPKASKMVLDRQDTIHTTADKNKVDDDKQKKKSNKKKDNNNDDDDETTTAKNQMVENAISKLSNPLQSQNAVNEATIYNLINYNIDTIVGMISEHNSLGKVMEYIYYLHPIYTGYDPDLGNVAHVSDLVSFYDCTASRDGAPSGCEDALACLPILASFYVKHRVAYPVGQGNGAPNRPGFQRGANNTNNNNKDLMNGGGDAFDPRVSIRQLYNKNVHSIIQYFQSKAFTYTNNRNQIRTFVTNHFLAHCKHFLSPREGTMSVLPYLCDMLVAIPSISMLPSLAYHIDNTQSQNDEIENIMENNIMSVVRHSQRKRQKRVGIDRNNNNNNTASSLSGLNIAEQFRQLSKPAYKAVVIASQQTISAPTWTALKTNAPEWNLMQQRIIPLMSKLQLFYEPTLTRQSVAEKLSKQYELTPNVLQVVYFDMSLTLRLFHAYEILNANDKAAVKDREDGYFKLLPTPAPSRRQIVLANIYDAATATAKQQIAYSQPMNGKPQPWYTQQTYFGFPNMLKQAITSEVKVHIATQLEIQHQEFLDRQKIALQEEKAKTSSQFADDAYDEDMQALMDMERDAQKKENNNENINNKSQPGSALNSKNNSPSIESIKYKGLLADIPALPNKPVKQSASIRSFVKPTAQQQQQEDEAEQQDTVDLDIFTKLPDITTYDDDEDAPIFKRKLVAQSRATHTLQLNFFDGFSDAVKTPVDMSFFLD